MCVCIYMNTLTVFLMNLHNLIHKWPSCGWIMDTHASAITFRAFRCIILTYGWAWKPVWTGHPSRPQCQPDTEWAAGAFLCRWRWRENERGGERRERRTGADWQLGKCAGPVTFQTACSILLQSMIHLCVLASETRARDTNMWFY